MDEVIDVAELQLHGGTDVVEADHLRVGGDDLQTALDASPVVVRDLEDEQVFKDVPVHAVLPGRSGSTDATSVLEACYFYPVGGQTAHGPVVPLPRSPR